MIATFVPVLGTPELLMLYPQVERTTSEHELYLKLFITTSGGL